MTAVVFDSVSFHVFRFAYSNIQQLIIYARIILKIILEINIKINLHHNFRLRTIVSSKRYKP